MVARTLEHAGEQGFGIWLALGEVCRAQLVLQHDEPAAAVLAIEKALARIYHSGSRVFESHVQSLLGDALRRQGRHGRAMRRMREAVHLIEEGGARWMESDVLRRRALCEADLGERTAALRTFEAAIIVARRQEARMLELRATMDLARLEAEKGDPAQARERLLACMAGFTEGFETRDLREARALSERLSA